MQLTAISTKDIPVGKMINIERDGKPIVVANVKGKYYAVGNVCTHMGCKLSEGTLSGERLKCPCHGSTFNVRTGAVVRGSASRPEPSYKVEISGDQISVIV